MKLTLYDYDNNKIVILKSDTAEYINGETYSEKTIEDTDGQSELTFILPLNITFDGVVESNHRWAYIVAEYLIKLEEDGETPKWYKIKSAKNIDDGGILESNIQCKSIAYELNKKNTELIPDKSGTASELIEYSLLNSGWSVGVVDSFNEDELTLLSTTTSNSLSLVNDVASLFNGSLTFNTDNKTVNLYSNDDVTDSQILFTASKNIQSLSREVSSEDIVTRLYITGGEIDTGTIGIQEANPTLEPYIDNFEYYVSNGMMNSTKEALATQYNMDMLSANTSLSNSQETINTTNNSITVNEVILNTKEYSKKSKEDRITEINSILTIETNPITMGELGSERTTLTSEISTLTTEITSVENSITSLQSILLSNTTDYDTILENKQITKDYFYANLGEFIHEGVYSNTSLILPESLYQDGLDILEDLSLPEVSYVLKVSDLSSQEGFELEKIKLGTLITVKDPFLKLTTKVKITKITRDLENPLDTTIVVANHYTTTEELLKDIARNYEIIKQQQSYWDRTKKSVNADGTINSSRLQDTFDLGVFATKNGTNNSIEQTENGIIFTSLDNANNMVKIDGDKISTSKDGGITWQTVVSSDGTNIANVFGGVLDVNEVYLKGDTYFFWNGDGFFAIDSTDTNKYIKFNKDGLFYTLDDSATYELSMTWNGLIIGSHTLSEIDESIQSGINFNNRNDRLSASVASPIVKNDGTAIDHTISTDGSSNLSFEWEFDGTGDSYNIDGFFVYVYQSTSSGQYIFGTTQNSEKTYTVDYAKRAMLIYGLPANQYYTFGVQAYRNVDQDINSFGIIKSLVAKSSKTDENPYLPDTNVAFNGNVTGTVSGTSASTLVAIANQALADASTAQSTADGKIVTFYQTSMPTTGTIGDLWFDSDDGNKLYRHNGETFLESQDDGISTAINNASTAQSTADGKIVTFYQTTAPTTGTVGDLWIDTNDTNKLYRHNGSTWDIVRDTDIELAVSVSNQALINASTAQLTADGKIVTFYQTSMPTTGSLGDLWFDSDNGNKLYRHNGSTFVESQDDEISLALSNASTAQSTADGKIVTFYQTTAPTTGTVGDLWIDTNDTNKLYRHNGSTWASARDTDIAVAISTANQALSNASTAQATADNKIVTFYQTSAPTGSLGDLWIDTDDGNKLYRHNGSSFVAVQDGGIGTAQNTANTAVSNASTAQGTANTALTNASTAQTTADSKIVTFYQTYAPSSTSASLGDLWVDTDNKNSLYRYNGSTWVTARDTDINLALTIANTSVQQDTFYNKTKISTTNGIQVFDNSNVQRVKIGQTDTDKYGMNLYYPSGALAQETLSDGSIKSYDESGNIVFDSTGLNSLQLSGFGVIEGLSLEITNVAYIPSSAYLVEKELVQDSVIVSSTSYYDRIRIYVADVTGVSVGDRVVLTESYTGNGSYIIDDGEIFYISTSSDYIEFGTSQFFGVSENIYMPEGEIVYIAKSTTSRIGSTATVKIKSGDLTRPDGTYFKLTSDYTLSNYDFACSFTDNDGFEIRVFWIDSSGNIRNASVGTSGQVKLSYNKTYVVPNSSLPNPRTTSIGGYPADPNAIILGAVLCGLGLGLNPPYIIANKDYRDIRALGVRKNVGDFDQVKLASSNQRNVSFLQNISGYAGDRITTSHDLGYGVTFAIVVIQRQITDVGNRGFGSETGTRKGVVLFVPKMHGEYYGTTAISPSYVTTEFEKSVTNLGYLASFVELDVDDLYLERAHLEESSNKEVKLYLDFNLMDRVISADFRITVYAM